MSDGKLLHFPGAKLSPDLMLRDVLDKMKGVKAIVIIVQMEDESIELNWTDQTVSSLCMAHRCFGIGIDKVINGEDDYYCEV